MSNLHPFYEAGYKAGREEVEEYAEELSEPVRKLLARKRYLQREKMPHKINVRTYLIDVPEEIILALEAALAKNPSPSAPQQASGSGPVPVSVEEAGSRAVETKQDSCAQGPDNDRRGAPNTELTEERIETRFFKRDGRWWRTVPADPTPEMLRAFEHHGMKSTVEGYDALLKAAPPFPMIPAVAPRVEQKQVPGAWVLFKDSDGFYIDADRTETFEQEEGWRRHRIVPLFINIAPEENKQ